MKRREYDDEGYKLWYWHDDLEGKYPPIRGLHKTEIKRLEELHAKLPVLISIPRPNSENKREILKQVEAELETMIEEQSSGENKI